MVTVNIFKKDGVQGVLVGNNNSFNAFPSPAVCIAEYKDTLAEYEARTDYTWKMSTTLFKLEMEQNVFVLEVDGDSFLEAMGKRDHHVKRVGTQACPLRIAEMTEEELEPYLSSLMSISTGQLVNPELAS